MSDTGCDMRRSHLVDGLWHASEPTCHALPAYEVGITFDDSERTYAMCPEHTAWARANWSSVTSVQQVARG